MFMTLKNIVELTALLNISLIECVEVKFNYECLLHKGVAILLLIVCTRSFIPDDSNFKCIKADGNDIFGCASSGFRLILYKFSIQRIFQKYRRFHE